jgi:hypothetical protein
LERQIILKSSLANHNSLLHKSVNPPENSAANLQKSVSRNIAGICKYLCVCHKFAEDLGNNILCLEMLPEILEISGVFRTIQKKIASVYGYA